MKLYNAITFGTRGPVPSRPARQVPTPEREDPQKEPEEDKPHRIPKRKTPEELEIVCRAE